jgi:hypothetical protein
MLGYRQTARKSLPGQAEVNLVALISTNPIDKNSNELSISNSREKDLFFWR